MEFKIVKKLSLSSLFCIGVELVRASLEAQRVKNPPTSAGDSGSIPGSGRFPGGEIATHCSILACRILLPWTEEPGRLQSKGCQKIGHN